MALERTEQSLIGKEVIGNYHTSLQGLGFGRQNHVMVHGNREGKAQAHDQEDLGRSKAKKNREGSPTISTRQKIKIQKGRQVSNDLCLGKARET